MSGHHHPLTCCDLECAIVNGCREGGYECERCGRWFCGSELDEDALCKDCAAEVAREREQWEKSVCAKAELFVALREGLEIIVQGGSEE